VLAGVPPQVPLVKKLKVTVVPAAAAIVGDTVAVSWNDAPVTSAPVGAPPVALSITWVTVVLGIKAAAAQVGPEMVLSSSVTVPADSAKTRPSKVAPVSKAVTPFCAIIVPINAVVVSRVAELPTLHHTLQGSPPVTDEPGDVMIVDTVLKIQTPVPVSCKFPLRVKLLVEQ
jgi:hypothetical protein